MAIFDNDGTVNREIGKVYDNNGTSDFQIDKIYDKNGTTDSLLYQSWNGELYENGNEFYEFTGGYAGSGYAVPYYPVDNLRKYSTHMTFGNPGGDGTAICGTNWPVDFTNFNTLVMEYDGSGWDAPIQHFGVSKSKNVSGQAASIELPNGARVVTIDISRMTGGYYIVAHVLRRGFIGIKKIYMR